MPQESKFMYDLLPMGSLTHSIFGVFGGSPPAVAFDGRHTEQKKNPTIPCTPRSEDRFSRDQTARNQHAIYKDSIPIPGVGYQSWTIGVGPGKHPLMLATNVGNETRISLCTNNIYVELYKPTICELIEFHADIKTSQTSATGVNWNLNTPTRAIALSLIRLLMQKCW